MTRRPAPSSHTNRTRHLSHWFISGKIKGERDGGKTVIQRLNEEMGPLGNPILSTWSWCKPGLPCLSHHIDHWLATWMALLVVNCIEVHLTSSKAKGLFFFCPEKNNYSKIIKCSCKNYVEFYCKYPVILEYLQNMKCDYLTKQLRKLLFKLETKTPNLLTAFEQI